MIWIYWMLVAELVFAWVLEAIGNSCCCCLYWLSSCVLHRLHPRPDRTAGDLLRLQDLQSELAHVGRVSEMGTLASSLAHELNQPLTAVSSYCESARDLLKRRPTQRPWRWCAKRWTKPPSRRSAPARSSAGCAIS